MFIALSSFSGQLASMAKVSNFTTCIFLNNQLCMTRATLTDLHFQEYSQSRIALLSIYG